MQRGCGSSAGAPSAIAVQELLATLDAAAISLDLSNLRKDDSNTTRARGRPVASGQVDQAERNPWTDRAELSMSEMTVIT